MDKVKELWASGWKGKALILIGGWLLLAGVLRMSGYEGDERATGDGRNAAGVAEALGDAGVAASNPRDNSRNCADLACIALITTDNVSVYEYAGETTAAAEASGPDQVAVGRFVLRFGGTLSANALTWPNRESYVVAAENYLAGGSIPTADPSLGMPGSNGCQLASAEFYDYLTENSRGTISRVYSAPAGEDWFLAVGRVRSDDAETATWFTKADPSSSGPFGSFGSEVYPLGIPAALVTSLQAGLIEEEEVEGEVDLIAALTECALME